MRDLARRLLLESRTATGLPVHEAMVVIEKLRVSLIRFAGADGFTSLLRRALIMATRDVPELQIVSVDAAGHLEGFERLVTQAGTGTVGNEAAVAITAHLLGLLVTFVGKPLTLVLIGNAWPDHRNSRPLVVPVRGHTTNARRS